MTTRQHRPAALGPYIVLFQYPINDDSSRSASEQRLRGKECCPYIQEWENAISLHHSLGPLTEAMTVVQLILTSLDGHSSRVLSSLLLIYWGLLITSKRVLPHLSLLFLCTLLFPMLAAYCHRGRQAGRQASKADQPKEGIMALSRDAPSMHPRDGSSSPSPPLLSS